MLVAAVADVEILPGAPIVWLYLLPVVVATFLAPVRWSARTAYMTCFVYTLSALLQESHWVVIVMYGLALAGLCWLVVMLVRQRERSQRLADEARAALRAGDAFVAVAAHELRSPLTSLSSAS